MQRIVMAALVAVSACGGGSAAPVPDGPAHLGVVAGNHQVVPAAPDARLPQDVVAQVVRLPNGSVALRVLDAVLPEKAYAQTTTVNGIPNQVVCFNAPDPKHALKAEVLCATSDALGKAVFVLHSDSVAGVSRGQVAAALATGTKITDSVSATVMPGAVATWIFPNGSTYFMNAAKVGVLFNLRDSILNVADRYHNSLPRNGYQIRYRRLSFVCPVPLVNGSCVNGYDRSGTDPAFITADTLRLRAGDLGMQIAVDSLIRSDIQIQYVP